MVFKWRLNTNNSQLCWLSLGSCDYYLNPQQMTGNNEIAKALAFGTPDPQSFLGFSLRFLLLAIPGILLGHILDESILLLQQKQSISPTLSLCIQTMIWILFFYILYVIFPRYGSEFQSSYAGIAFVTLFFTVQTNYVKNLQQVIRIADRSVV